MSKGRVLMTVAAEYRDRPNPLEDVLRMVRFVFHVSSRWLRQASYRYSKSIARRNPTRAENIWMV